jgi:hypothetical protein
MLMVLGGLAEFERELILARTGDGRARAMARGVQFGRPPKLTAHQRQEGIQRLRNHEAQTDVARSYAVSQATISRLVPRPFACASAVAWAQAAIGALLEDHIGMSALMRWEQVLNDDPAECLRALRHRKPSAPRYSAAA